AASMPLAAQPAAAQGSAVPGTLTLTPAERTALFPLKQAVDARNWAAASAMLPAARSGVSSAGGRYALARLELDIALGTQNRAAQIQAINAVLETRQAPADEEVELLRQYAAVTYDAGNLNLTEAMLTRALRAAPNDPEALSMLAQLHRNRGNNPQAINFFQRALRAAEASGRRLPESRYRLALALAEQAGQRAPAVEFARLLVSAHPSAINWRDALIVLRTVGTPDPSQNLDALRLMRATGALAGERDYMLLAQALETAGLPGEVKAVLDEGVSRGMIAAADAAPRALLASATQRATRERAGLTALVNQARGATATATQARAAGDALYGYGRYAEAAELYRLALTRAGEDPNLVNVRLGAALAAAGQRAEAEAALRAVTGPRAELAALWLAWATRRAA
ncbi:MAG TPA: tetratricopeptide repeat protein, partial [Allosphingosinicella sp.]